MIITTQLRNHIKDCYPSPEQERLFYKTLLSIEAKNPIQNKAKISEINQIIDELDKTMIDNTYNARMF